MSVHEIVAELARATFTAGILWSSVACDARDGYSGTGGNFASPRTARWRGRSASKPSVIIRR